MAFCICSTKCSRRIQYLVTSGYFGARCSSRQDGDVVAMAKYTHEIRDAIHAFVRLDSDERRVLDSRPFQRLRNIHQLALTYLVYPGATHRRFEHSIGVMDLAGR